MGRPLGPAGLGPGAGEKLLLRVRGAPLAPDRLWVSALLRRVEKAFLAQLAGATAQVRARWGLHSSPLLDQMVAELQQDVGRRLQESSERELRNAQSWVGRTALLREGLGRELSLDKAAQAPPLGSA
ncbi:Retinitis pigmentosa 1-like 1 protein [Galemys pyrenaicus]|uniref:Retinitis pigmentosa 1-like 1 protein n=1 Tax=Galemys pyrenaicus TaxID=202257 RepID=A0A8J5ZII9_GALPY|nr:Retinitis pigmentosa 1-like 1 protein [Galemys pyrenaicus]